MTRSGGEYAQSVNSPARWAKTPRGRDDLPAFHRLAHHGIDVASCLEVGFERNPVLIERLSRRLAMPVHTTRPMLLALGALHDVGKVMSAFQALQPELALKLG